MNIKIDKLVDPNLKDNSLAVLLKAPDGYTIDKVLLTTFTMSKRVLADIYMYYASEKENISIEEMSEIQKRLFLIKAFEEYTDCIDVYLQEEQLLGCISTRKLEGLDEFLTGKISTLHKVNKPENGFFHPKILLISYTKENSEPIYRLYISSKNLTYDTFFQTGIMLRGEIKPEGNNGKDLKDFIESFAGKEIPQLVKDIENVSFYYEKPGDVSLLFFIPDSHQNEDNITKIKNDFQNSKACLFFSDSIRKDFFENIFDDKMPEKTCVAVSNCRSWAKALETDEIPQYAYILDSTDPPYIHSKMYFASDDNGKVTYYVGSANCTWSALQNNYEVMVRVETKVNEKVDSFIEIEGSTSLKWKNLEKENLVNARAIESIIEYIKNMKVSCCVSKKDSSYSMELVVKKPEEETEKKINRLILCIPNDYHRYDLVFDDNGEYKLSWDNVIWSKIPFEKKALVFVDSEMGKGTVDINIELTCPEDINIEEQSTDFGKNLFKGHLPTVKEAIPAVSREYKGFYDINDSDDIRIAKYIAYCRKENIKNPYENIRKGCEELLEKCSEYTDNDGDDEFSDFFDAEDFNRELDVAKNKIKRLMAFLEVKNNG